MNLRTLRRSLFVTLTLGGALALPGCAATDAVDGANIGSESSAASAAAAEAPILLVHGLEVGATATAGGWDCAKVWGNQRRLLSRAGVTGPVISAGYYHTNRGCDRNVEAPRYTKDFAGDVTLERGSQQNILTNDTPIEHVAYRLAWLMAEVHNENPGRPLRIIADCLGGLVVRWALTQSSAGNPNYPGLGEMAVSSVYTYATPHAGTKLAVFGPNDQAQQLRPDSPLLTALRGSDLLTSIRGSDRQGSAQWYSFASTLTGGGDGMISVESACWPSSTCFVYSNPAYSHISIGSKVKYLVDTNDTVRRDHAYRIRQPNDGGVSEPVDDVGAPAVAARMLRTQLR